MVRRLLRSYQLEKNSFRSRYNRHCYLPTSHCPNVAYFNPSEYNGVQGLIPVPKHEVNRILSERFPDARDLFQVSPPLLADHVSQVLRRVRVSHDSIALINLWVVHQCVVTALRHVQHHLYIMPADVEQPEEEWD
ncbi:hypothetical protein CROQUDRAFT_670131 [Cronartium quercuum f. sp. fusiforme G11]|uniref:Uncharacterized protein n=1 Tax=Cronartium quercuum f. sp. fusiforme G11 TaxID=708437 RepID=A0A9P6TDR8_9BASI|nr:hypothetical protein CROQUDRAFT_670131 [Cronartium quercuum f. sp. fusiforme G11]